MSQQENLIREYFNSQCDELADLPVNDDQAEEAKGGEFGHGTHVSGTIGVAVGGRV